MFGNFEHGYPAAHSVAPRRSHWSEGHRRAERSSKLAVGTSESSVGMGEGKRRWNSGVVEVRWIEGEKRWYKRIDITLEWRHWSTVGTDGLNMRWNSNETSVGTDWTAGVGTRLRTRVGTCRVKIGVGTDISSVPKHVTTPLEHEFQRNNAYWKLKTLIARSLISKSWLVETRRKHFRIFYSPDSQGCLEKFKELCSSPHSTFRLPNIREVHLSERWSVPDEFIKWLDIRACGGINTDKDTIGKHFFGDISTLVLGWVQCETIRGRLPMYRSPISLLPEAESALIHTWADNLTHVRIEYVVFSTLEHWNRIIGAFLRLATLEVNISGQFIGIQRAMEFNEALTLPSLRKLSIEARDPRGYFPFLAIFPGLRDWSLIERRGNLGTENVPGHLTALERAVGLSGEGIKQLIFDLELDLPNEDHSESN
ncbi:hypothetical protein PQX77_022218 [Marasmius sp. AFHP31]|nr:hypothetical protein PQX77_022218 [Marasmius sp. AFHP31]